MKGLHDRDNSEIPRGMVLMTREPWLLSGLSPGLLRLELLSYTRVDPEVMSLQL